MPFQTDPSWTPSRYQAALSVWRAQAPANDSDIIPARKRVSNAPRPLAGVLAPLLRWGDIVGRTTGDTTNYLQADNDNHPDTAEARDVDRLREIRPSINEMSKSFGDVTFREIQHARADVGGDVDIVPVAGDIENDGGRLSRMGQLRFSDGTNTEPCFVFKDAKVKAGECRLPAGALMGATEKPGQALGAGREGSDVSASNRYYADALGTCLPRYVKAGRRRPRVAGSPPALPPTTMPFAEARTFAGLVPVEPERKPALPCGAPSVSDSFLGLKTAASGKAPLPAWEDIATSIAVRQEEALLRRMLSDRDVLALETALIATSFESIGAAFGHTGDYARRAGKQILLAANENLAVALNKIAV